MEFETARCIIRKLEMDDLEDFYDMQSNENVMRFIKAPLNYEESVEELKKFIAFYSDDSRYFHLWAVEHRENKAFLGICGVYKNNDDEHEIAYRLREKYWGQGLGKEIAKSLISHCIDSLKIDKIVAFADVENSGSIKILNQEMKFVEKFYSSERNRYSHKYKLIKA